MRDQVDDLVARGIKACFLGSAQSEQETCEESVLAGRYDIVYITPEKLACWGYGVAALHKRSGISLIAVDEAHCICEMGHNFRPSYRDLGNIRDLVPGVPILALTATATPDIRRDIIKTLRMS